MLTGVNKIFLSFLLLTVTIGGANAQIKAKGANDSLFTTFYQQRSSLFRLLPQTTGDIIFLGNSITNGNEWGELFGEGRIKNRGISGDLTTGVLNRLDEVTARKPDKIFLLIGINDLAAGIAPDTVAARIFQIARQIHEQTPGTKLYIQSLLPVNDAFNKFPTHVKKSAQVQRVNATLSAGASAGHYQFLDLNPFFCNDSGKLDTLYTNDGLHQKGAGYLLWKHLIFPYVYDLQPKPSLLPLPRSLTWTDERFPLYQCRVIWLQAKQFEKEATMLRQTLAQMGLHTVVVVEEEPVGIAPVIVLRKQKDLSEEAYQLFAGSHKLEITANTPHGCFNALQTLQQLMRDGLFIPGVAVKDQPSLAWRGYMVDVGRNYLSVPLLKQQIDIMAKYKLNIFHLHLTEDLAWRLQIKQYPQLTEPGNMERNKGAYYTIDELKDLIAYCKARYIKLIPEIDIPGHSAAFKRTFKCGMQSDTGMLIVKNILKEVCDTYDIPYLHIGGDEVKITNRNFLPNMVRYIQSRGKQTIAWSPGGNLDNQTIRQLWMSEGPVDPKVNYLDSRNLYINHMDPLESVTSIYNRRLDSSKNMLGSILCLWPDRNVREQMDILKMNPIYPAMLTFAERAWAGGGRPGWSVAIPDNHQNFTDFENRLIDQQKQYFDHLPFPYARQSNLHWRLYGPYNNHGKLETKFSPEKMSPDAIKDKYQRITGGTIILRHFWHPIVSGVLNDPKANATYYARASVFCAQDTTALLWAGFYNISRSVATVTPASGQWDDRHSGIWLNHQVIPAPAWLHPGQGALESPLSDEGYEYRAPICVHLRHGWNDLLLKLPVSSFQRGQTQNPVKWMFTAVFVKPMGQNYIEDDQLIFLDN